MSIKQPIVVQSVSKCYQIYSHPKDRLKQAISSRWREFLGKPANSSKYYREFWALRDISFALEPGETVGILGRNGAGKSTLLQIIVGTLAPTSGEVITNGRITALLELGSGFNPEFTGRENVLLNAQILGLTPEQALDRFDEIASFADIGDFIDQPVKTYSSGMMVRVAFAVQTAVDPKILIVDEALAVGDMFFQAKCIARIKKLVDEGVALLFVSHDTGVVRQLCSRAVLLQEGRLAAIGDAKSVAEQYTSVQLEERNRAAKIALEAKEKRAQALMAEKTTWSDHPLKSRWLEGMESFLVKASHNRVGNQQAEILNVQMLSQDRLADEFDFDAEARIRIFVGFNQNLDNLNAVLKICNRQGMPIVYADTRIQERMEEKYQQGKIYTFDWHIRLPLMAEQYFLLCGLSHPPAAPGEDWVFVDIVQHAYDFTVAPRRAGTFGGYVVLPARLEISAI